MRLENTVALIFLLAMPFWGQARPKEDMKGIPANFGRGDYVNQRDGSVMVNVPAGEFFMGASPLDKIADYREKPPRMVRLQSYQISKYEVTNAQYARFVKVSGYRSGDDRWQEYAAKWGPKAPVVNVSWQDAAAYCKWAGLRLPTEAEWERAARGTDKRIYPWGDNWDAARAVCGDVPKDVGSKPTGISPVGCLDMAGNAAEWVDDWCEPEPEKKENKMERGGNFGDGDLSSSDFRCSQRWTGCSPDTRLVITGFRCARTAPK